MSRMCTRSSLYFEVTQMVFFHSWMSCNDQGNQRDWAVMVDTSTDLQDLAHHGTQHHRRTFRKPADQLVQEFLRCDLQVERVSAFLDEGFEELNGEEGSVGIA